MMAYRRAGSGPHGWNIAHARLINTDGELTRV